MDEINAHDMKRILIAGAGIAGPTTAFWLAKNGYEVTIVERSEALRTGGQNIDVKGAAEEVAHKMGILEQIRQANTTEVGTKFVDRDNEVTATFHKGDVGALTSDLEILRGDLVQILYDLTKEQVAYRFGDAIKTATEDSESVNVTFESGKKEQYDLVIGADGQRSSLRELVFGDEPELKYLGLYTSYLTIPKGPNDSEWARWYVATSPETFWCGRTTRALPAHR